MSDPTAMGVFRFEINTFETKLDGSGVEFSKAVTSLALDMKKRLVKVEVVDRQDGEIARFLGKLEQDAIKMMKVYPAGSENLDYFIKFEGIDIASHVFDLGSLGCGDLTAFGLNAISAKHVMAFSFKKATTVADHSEISES
jgi:hypothetical protein